MTISVRLGEELEQRLESLAKRTGRTKSHYIREVLIERLEELEDLYIAERVLENPSEKRWKLQELIDGKDMAH
ncbi:MAG TPA: anti-toxin [Alphaproteobacteria bacterium]|nr:anti-toxin [Alphaproteobacteria bacterium]